MGEFKTKMKKYIKKKKEAILKSKTLVFILGVIIGSTTIYIYLVGRPYYNWVKRGLQYTETVSVYRAEVEPEIVGNSVSTELWQQENLSVPNKDRIEELVALYFPEDAQNAIAIAYCENDTLDPLRNNTTGNYPADSIDRGIFMINDYWHSEVSDECAYDAECNIKEAKRIYDKRGWQPWTCKGVIK